MNIRTLKTTAIKVQKLFNDVVAASRIIDAELEKEKPHKAKVLYYDTEVQDGLAAIEKELLALHDLPIEADTIEQRRTDGRMRHILIELSMALDDFRYERDYSHLT